MKRIYIIPETEVLATAPVLPMAASGVTGNNGIGYGGVDNEGEQDPSVKESSFDFTWE